MSQRTAGLRPFLARVVRLAVTIGLFLFVLHLVDLSTVLSTIASASLPLLALAAAILIPARALMCAKWLILLRRLIPDVPIWPAARIYLASGLAQYVGPTFLAADALRAIALGREEKATAEVTASVIMERVLGLAALGLTSTIALSVAATMSIRLTFLIPWTLLAVLFSVAALVIPMSRQALGLTSKGLGHLLPAVGGFLARLGAAYRSYKAFPGLLVVIGLGSVLEQMLSIMAVWLMASALGLHVTIPMLIVVMPLALFSVRLPISLAGLGVGEGAFIYLLGLFSVPPDGALALAIVGRAVDMVVVASPGVLWWRFLTGALRPAQRQTEEAL